MRAMIAALFLAGLCLAQVAQGQDRDLGVAGRQGKRVALVVGMSRYHYVPPLSNPNNDALLIAKTLKSLGFTLVGDGALLDLDKTGFDRAIQAFGEQIAAADVALFYFAGHGLQVRGANWLVPVSANPTRETDLDFQMIDAQLVLKQMEAAGTRLNIVVLDACRNNPFGERGLRAVSGGLAQMQAPEGTLISYATQPGNTALDGADAHSPYSGALAEALSTPGLEVQRVFNQVGVRVKRMTGGSQQPWVAASPIEGEFYFAGAASSGVTAVTVETLSPGVDPKQIELSFWDSIRTSTDPRDFQAYLDKYPHGQFADLARNRIKSIAPQIQVAVQTPPSDVASGRRKVGVVSEAFSSLGYVVVKLETGPRIALNDTLFVDVGGAVRRLQVQKLDRGEATAAALDDVVPKVGQIVWQ